MQFSERVGGVGKAVEEGLEDEAKREMGAGKKVVDGKRRVKSRDF